MIVVIVLLIAFLCIFCVPGILLVGRFKQQLVPGPSFPGSFVRWSLPVIFPM
jgi:hypothetical protein